jgi:hypothetical protein
MVHGMVERPLIFTMEDLTRFPSESRICFIECAGNSWASCWPRPPALAVALPPPVYGLGTPASPVEIAGCDIDVRGDGAGLPPGRGSVAQGRALYRDHCAACHGSAGEGGLGDALTGGTGTLGTAKPVRTVGSYWPFAPRYSTTCAAPCRSTRRSR